MKLLLSVLHYHQQLAHAASSYSSRMLRSMEVPLGCAAHALLEMCTIKQTYSNPHSTSTNAFDYVCKHTFHLYYPLCNLHGMYGDKTA